MADTYDWVSAAEEMVKVVPLDVMADTAMVTMVAIAIVKGPDTLLELLDDVRRQVVEDHQQIQQHHEGYLRRRASNLN